MTSKCSTSHSTTTNRSLRLLVLHDDGEREFDYTSGAEEALEKASKEGWTVVSIKNDWATVFLETLQQGFRCRGRDSNPHAPQGDTRF